MTADDLLAGRYRIGQLIGRGGMADVYEAEDERLSRRVAVKLLHRNLIIDPDVLARFEREAQSAARLSHQSIVTVYDNGQVDHQGAPQPYIVMERIDGVTLREVLDDARHTGQPGLSPSHPVDPEATRFAADPGSSTTVMDAPVPSASRRRATPLAIPQAVKLTSGVLSALAYSHKHGVVHRDIKPGNVMLTPTGNVKVMDFGIARVTTDATAAMTRTNTVLGTAQYLSPEQAKGEAVDARSDLYSTGCLLYELLTGRPPFTGDTAVSLAFKHVGEIPDPPSIYNGQIPESIDRVTMKALAKDPADRYPDAEHFRADLAAAMAGQQVVAPPVPVAGSVENTVTLGAVSHPGPRPGHGAQPLTEHPATVASPPRDGRRWGYLALILAVLAVASGMGYTYWKTQQPPPVVYVEVPNLQGKTQADARSALTGAGLKLALGAGLNSDLVPKGNVVQQDPGANKTVARDSSVTVQLSLGPAAVKIPDVRGKSQAEARKLLEKSGLRVGNVTTQDSPTAKKDVVLATTPAAGAGATRNAVVTLVVSTGEVTLTNFVGKNVNEAKAWLKQNNLEAKVVFEPSTKPLDQVIGQEPGGGSVPQGSVVSLYVATTPPPPPTTSPTTAPTDTGSPEPSYSPSPTST